MRPGARLAVDLLAAVLVAAATTPILAPLLPGVPAHRLLARVLLAVLLLLVLRRRAVTLGPTWRDAGLGRYDGATDDVAFGFVAGGVVGLLLLAMYADGALVPPAAPVEGRAILGALGTAAAVAVVEEVLFRGAALRAWGAVGSSLVYAVVHFLRPATRTQASDLDPLLGLRVLGEMLAPLGDPLAWLPGAAGLFLLGLLLSLARRLSGALYLGMGLHAGGVFFLRLFDAIADHDLSVRPWLWGATYPRPLSGPAGWAGLVVVWVLLEVYLRRRRDSPAGGAERG